MEQENELQYLEENELGIKKIKQECLDKLKSLKAEQTKLDKKYKELSNAIIKEIETITTETTPFGEYNYVVKGGFFSVQFDEERFKEEHPYLYLDYLKPSFSKVSTSLVKATREKKQ